MDEEIAGKQNTLSDVVSPTNETVQTPETALGLINGEQRIEQDRVDKIAHQLGSFYSVDEKVVTDTSKTPTYLISEQKLVEKLLEKLPPIKTILEKDSPFSQTAESLGVDWKRIIDEFNRLNAAQGVDSEALNEYIKQQYVESKTRKFKMYGGLHVRNGNERTIYLSASEWNGESYEGYIQKKTRTLRHEIIHDLGIKQKGGSGFVEPTGAGVRFNEAATQLLEIVERNPDTTSGQLLEKVRSGAIETSYKTEVMFLLLSAHATDYGSQPINLQKDLAEFYFADDEPGINRILFEMELRKRTPNNQSNNLLQALAKLND